MYGIGFDELRRFCRQSLCPELAEFHAAYRIYRSCRAELRKEIAAEIMNQFLTPGAQLMIDLFFCHFCLALWLLYTQMCSTNLVCGFACFLVCLQRINKILFVS